MGTSTSSAGGSQQTFAITTKAASPSASPECVPWSREARKEAAKSTASYDAGFERIRKSRLPRPAISLRALQEQQGRDIGTVVDTPEAPAFGELAASLFG